jgi:hypothetical protein
VRQATIFRTSKPDGSYPGQSQSNATLLIARRRAGDQVLHHISQRLSRRGSHRCIHGGTAANIITDDVLVLGTIRAFGQVGGECQIHSTRSLFKALIWITFQPLTMFVYGGKAYDRREEHGRKN